MSTRQLKRIKEKDLVAALPAPCESDEEEVEPSKVPFNPFSLLDEEEEVSRDDVHLEEEEEADHSIVSSRVEASSNTATKKKKNKKVKKKPAFDEKDSGPSAVEAKYEASVAEIDRIVKELNLQTTANSSSSVPLGRNADETSPASLLLIDVRSLRGEDELRRIFGSDVLLGMAREERANAAQGQRQAHGLRGMGAGRYRKVMKKGLLVNPKEHWPPFEGGLEMSPSSSSSSSSLPNGLQKGDKVLYVNRKDRSLAPAEIIHVDNSTSPPQYGIRREGAPADAILYTEADRLRQVSTSKSSPLLQYRMSPAYRSTQHLFEQAKQSHDPQAIAMILRRSPYHVDSLLQMHELYRSMGENNYAEDCLARALYTLEMGFHSSFDLASPPTLRLDYAVEENRALFTALFRHVQHLSRQGCHKAAFECCKLLLSLEPLDPMGALFLIDYLALRADREEWLISFTQKFKEGLTPLSALPNFSFASSLARFRLALKGRGSIGEALGQMVQAVQLHPYLVPKIISHLIDKGSCREGFWQLMLTKKMFEGRIPEDELNPSLTHLVAIFVERSGLLWKPADALELLRCSSMIASGLCDKMSPEAAAASASSPQMMGTSQPFQFDLSHRIEAANIASGLTDEAWTLVRKEAFPPPQDHNVDEKPQSSLGGMMRTFLGLGTHTSSSTTQVNNYGHLRLDDFSDNVARLPAEEMNAVLQPRAAAVAGGVDDDEEAMEEIAQQMAIMQQMEREREGGGHLQEGMDEEIRQMNPLLMMLRTLMPWVNAGQQPDYDGDDQEGEDEGR